MHLASKLLVAALSLTAVLLVGCSRSSDSGSAQSSSASGAKVLLRGNGPEPDSLDPQKARSFESHNVIRDLCEGLTEFAQDASPAPGAAHTWDVSPDGLTYTFHLRPEAKWSNGDPVVAADFVAGLRRLVDPATASQNAQLVEVIENAPEITRGEKQPEELGVSAPDDATVVVKLSAPAPYLPGLLSHVSACPVHRPTLAQHGADFARPGVTVSNGAFVLKEWVPGSHILVERNRNYWNDAATRLDAVRFLHIADENAEFTRYRAGQLHITAVVPNSQIDWVRDNLPDELRISPQLNTYYYGFNLTKPPFKDNLKLRRALSLVIDRERLVDTVLRVGGMPAYGWVPPGIHNYMPQSFDYRDMPMEQRIEEAKRLYAEAGYSASRPLQFELRYNSGGVHDRIAVVAASMWKEALGAQVQLRAVEFKSLLQDIDRGNVQLFRSSWLGDYNDAYTFAQYLKSDFGINLPRYRNPKYDDLLNKAAAEVDPRKRRALLEQAERVMLADHPLMPIYFYVNKHLVKPEVEGWYDNVMNIAYSKHLGLKQPSANDRGESSE
jgi:oligopeptide transport system substrate-binding protein